MRLLQHDSGSVECGKTSREQCHLINSALGLPGIEVNPVNIDMQEQNVIERYVQTHGNTYAAMMADTEVVPSSFWGLGVAEATRTLNKVTNSLCDDGLSPDWYFKGRTTDMNYQFRVGFGKLVVATRVAEAKGSMLPGITRNELGVTVGSTDSNNGAVWVWLPSRGRKSLSLRFHVREIRMGSQRQMTTEEGKDFIPMLGPDGKWQVPSRGEAGGLAKAFALSCDADLTSTVSYDRAEISTMTLDSSITMDHVMQKLASMTQQETTQQPEIFAQVHKDEVTGKPCDENNMPIQLSQNAEMTEKVEDEEVPGVLPTPRRAMRSSSSTAKPRKRWGSACAEGAYTVFVSLCCSGSG